MTVPVVPDAETARRWVETELSDPIYHDRPSLLEMLLTWVGERLQEISGAALDLDARTAALVVGGIALVVALVALAVAGPVRRARRAQASVAVLADDVRSRDELLAAADLAAREGRWTAAVLDRFRALLRGLEDRALLDVRPGRTAHEAAEEGARVLPACAEDLHRAGRLFDDVCYGSVPAGPDDDTWMRELDARVAAGRPIRWPEVVG